MMAVENGVSNPNWQVSVQGLTIINVWVHCHYEWKFSIIKLYYITNVDA